MGAELTYADFRHADLRSADMRRATMVRAVLHGAQTDQAQISDRARAIETDADLAAAEQWQPAVA